MLACNIAMVEKKDGVYIVSYGLIIYLATILSVFDMYIHTYFFQVKPEPTDSIANATSIAIWFLLSLNGVCPIQASAR